MYIEASTVVAGAEEDREVFTDYMLYEVWLDDVRADAYDTGYRIEVYEVEHDHPIGEDCECVQYLQDHRPAHVFNADGNV